MNEQTTVTCLSKLAAPRGELLTAEDVAAWAADLPPEATVNATMRDEGTQRDPLLALAALTAVWTETR